MKFDVDTLVNAALSLVNREGLDKLNMRALAKEMSVTAGALYRYVDSREQLEGLMALKIVRQAVANLQVSDGWRSWLTDYAHALRATLLSLRDSARLCIMAEMRSGWRPSSDLYHIPSIMVDQLGERLAVVYLMSVFALTIGFVAVEQSNSRVVLKSVFNFDENFGVSIDAMVRGFN